jgi:hypothetical protein
VSLATLGNGMIIIFTGSNRVKLGKEVFPDEEINCHPLVYKKQLIGRFMSDVYRS